MEPVIIPEGSLDLFLDYLKQADENRARVNRDEVLGGKRNLEETDN